MKLTFLMPHLIKNSVKDKMISKKQIYSERNTPHREFDHCRGPQNFFFFFFLRLAFMGWVISKVNEWEDYFHYFGEGVEISSGWSTAHFLVFDS